MTRPYVERALFVIGDQDTGKSTQLRSMFLDWRLGNGGVVPTARNVQNAYALSNERWLYLRLTSPHEAGETTNRFLNKCAAAMQANGLLARRWNFSGPLQPTGTGSLPAAPDVVEAFAKRFVPERIRIAILNPDRHGNWMPKVDLLAITDAFRNLPATEVVAVDATSRTANGLMYADFFDFT